MERIVVAAKLLNRFGWLRAYELSLFLCPNLAVNAGSRRTIARRVVNQLKRMKLVDTRALPGGSEAIFLNGRGIGFCKEIGEIYFNRFNMRSVASDWRHDCYVAQMLAALVGGRLDCLVTEFEILMEDGPNIKRPDGLVFLNDYWSMLEVENARKSGPNLRHQSIRVEKAVVDGMDYAGRWVTGATLCYPMNISGVNHRTRLINSLHDTKLSLGPASSLFLIGFEIASQTHATTNMIVMHDGMVFSKSRIERGLPAEIHTGQKRGALLKPSDVEVQWFEEENGGWFFRLANADVTLEYGGGPSFVRSVEIVVDEQCVGSMHYEAMKPLKDVLDQVFTIINHLSRDSDGRFIVPHRCLQ